MTSIVGLLPVSARRLYVYWEAPRRFDGRLTIHAGPGWTLGGLESSGGRFLDDVAPGDLTAELQCDGEVLASTGSVAVERGERTPAYRAETQLGAFAAPEQGSRRVSTQQAEARATVAPEASR